MRKRYGQAPCGEEAEAANARAGGEDGNAIEERVGDGAGAKDRFSWMNAVTAGAQLTLDLIRVVREATDLYRKLARCPVSRGSARSAVRG